MAQTIKTWTPTPRPSSSERLENLYKSINTKNTGAAPDFGGGIRATLVDTRVTVDSMAWGLSSKAGSPIYQSMNRFQGSHSYERKFQPTEFAVRRTQNNSLGNDFNTSFNNFAQQYAKLYYNHDNRRYT